MSRPVLFALDDDAGVVRALRGDLSRRFGRDFRVLGESSAAAGLATLNRLPQRPLRVGCPRPRSRTASCLRFRPAA
jgi:hypothetical protein